ncbi:protein kinase [Streptomyces sp. VMFN-G11Ma]|uniref:protein kinase n=1 Tax=Streptomyces sp. VMFN-G11Ma TaxID=2135609 RepID=UPI000D349919|nr:protein kinase [Streptomyces sp. VMFN-G11Ma]PTM92544.1 serine/threonine protein kinase [Streptomyces sp. VMFN-G11Ma]
MDDYAGRVLADRYRLPLPPADEYELTDTRAFDTYSGQEVLVRQVPLPEVVEAEVLDAEGLPDGFTARDRGARSGTRAGARRPTDPAVLRAVEAAQAAARIPDHPRLDQVFDVFAEGGSLWIVSELVEARPLAALLAEKLLTPYRAAEVASDVLMALRVLHAHGWVHRNITARTVLVCDDGRVMLTGLAVGAAEEALCGYDPVPAPESDDEYGRDGGGGLGAAGGSLDGAGLPENPGLPGARSAQSAQGSQSAQGAHGAHVAQSGLLDVDVDPEAARRAAIGARAAGGLLPAGTDAAHGSGASSARAPKALESGGDIRAARAGAIAAYRAGARAAARVQEAQQNGRAALPGALPGARSAPEDGSGAQPNGGAQTQTSGDGTQHASTTPGQIADPYGVNATPWHGAAPRTGAGGPPSTGANGASGLAGGQGDQGGEGSQAGQGSQGGRTALPPGGTGNGGGGYGAPSAPGAPAPGLNTAPPAGVPAPSPGNHTHGGPALPGPGPGSAPAPLPPGATPPSRWDDLVAGTPGTPGIPVTPGTPGVPGAPTRGPATPLAAERARQARMAVVGPVTERWAPEQAGPVHENWQLAPPIGPATDLWALGALLFRAVQGHAPYPEESTAELVQMVCAEPPAFAEECGPLRPVVESLLRQDPTERLDFEELRGWLRSLVRSAPEPDAGAHVIAAPPADTSRLPVVRRRGELVRRRRAGLPATSPHGRHKRAKKEAKSPHRLGRTLLLLVLLLLAAAIAYAVLFMPKSGEDGAAGSDRTGSAGQAGPVPTQSHRDASSAPRPDQTSPKSEDSPSSSKSAGATQSQTTGPDVAAGFTLRKDPEGFEIAVAKGWSRAGKNAWNQVVYSHGDFELVVVKGRDGAVTYGSDPMAYQRDTEHELQPYRSSSWATATGLRTVTVGTRTMAEGQFTWTDGGGHDLYVRNLAMLIDGRYHIVQVRGPESQRDEVTKLYEQASKTYQVTG